MILYLYLIKIFLISENLNDFFELTIVNFQKLTNDGKSLGLWLRQNIQKILLPHTFHLSCLIDYLKTRIHTHSLIYQVYLLFLTSILTASSTLLLLTNALIMRRSIIRSRSPTRSWSLWFGRSLLLSVWQWTRRGGTSRRRGRRWTGRWWGTHRWLTYKGLVSVKGRYLVTANKRQSHPEWVRATYNNIQYPAQMTFWRGSGTFAWSNSNSDKSPY